MTGLDARGTDLGKELDATLRIRKELGEEYEPALIESFLEKVDQHIDGAVDRRLRRHLAEQQTARARGAQSPRATESWGERHGLGAMSLVLAIPLSAVGGVVGQLPGLVLAWVGIVGVNAVQAARSRPGLFTRRGRTQGDEGWED
ncbi:hypothetical protein ACIHAA_21755 [Streptomyces sp. NPDC052040]|uniref:hypothetical protein n=1 Tax=unclassified Streptomyces TaxID=2593676 RepID=UPI0037D73222